VSETASPKRFAWEPITLPGVAAFAEASVGRLLLVQCVVALIAASVVVWFVKTAWSPEISSAIEQLPAKGEIRDGKLNWPAESPQVLVDGHFLALIVDLEHEGQMHSPAHVQVEFGREDVRIFSLFGYKQVVYPREWIFAFNRVELKPKWGAWRPPILWITFGTVVVVLMANWAALATIYFLPTWLVGFFANRKINFRAAWKLAGAALMPGALFLVAAILFYGWRWLDLVQLTAAYVAHFVIGFIYVIVAPLFAPKLKLEPSLKKNPFTEK
jgi:hypothetical protein